MEKLHETSLAVKDVVWEEFSMKNLVVYLVIVLLLLFQIGCSSDNTHKISTVTLEKIKLEGDASSEYIVSWRLVADPAPDKDLVVVIGGYRKSDDWFDYDRREWKNRIKSDEVPPFYAVIEKSNGHSSTYHKRIPVPRNSLQKFIDELPPVDQKSPRVFLDKQHTFSMYINTLPSVSIVGQGISIDTDTLADTLPAKTLGGHIIPVGHEFVPYRVGKECGLSKNGVLLTK